jgi:16S rRNA (guanine527-N7)-methyltransferase
VSYGGSGRNWRIREWFPELEEKAVSALEIYHQELIEANARINLISPRSETNADLVHFADAILGGRLIFEKERPKEVYDLGSGNGIPGLVMAAIYRDIKFIAVDSDSRKIEFLKFCSSRMGLSNFSAIHSRVESLPKQSIHFAISRGLASISKALLLARKNAAGDCKYYHFKSQSWAKEVAEIPSQIIAHWEPIHVRDYYLPDQETGLSVVLTRRL